MPLEGACLQPSASCRSLVSQPLALNHSELSYTSHVLLCATCTGEGNPHHYFVASQDPELKRKLKRMPGVCSLSQALYK